MVHPISNDECFDRYRKEISGIDVLEPEEVIACGRLARKGDIDARRLLILSHLKYVVDVARQHLGGELPLSELVCWGNLGLLDAVEGYDPDYSKDPEAVDDPEHPKKSKDVRSPGLFTTYAKWYIEKYIREAKKAWSGTGDNRPDIYEKMADYLTIDLNSKPRRKNSRIEPFAWLEEILLDAPAYSSDSEGETNESIVASESLDPSVWLSDEDSRNELNRILAETLSKEERLYIEEFFGYHGEPKSQWEIAREQLVDDPRIVARAINKAVAKLNRNKRIRELRGCISR